jgi:hypothetical protein
MQMICMLVNTLLNLQQMSTQQAVHIALSFPLNFSSRDYISIRKYLIDEHTFILKPSFLLKKEPENFIRCNVPLYY